MKEAARKILVLELWGIGDVIMMSAVLGPLRGRFPAAEISVLSQAHGRDVLLNNQDVSRVFVFKFPWTAFKAKYHFWRWDWRGILGMVHILRQERFDLVLDGRGDLRNDFLSWLIAPRRYVCRDGAKVGGHRIDHWGMLLQKIGVQVKDLRPRVVITHEESLKARQFMESRFSQGSKKLVGIHPGAAQRIRCWPLERFEALASRLTREAAVHVLMFVEPDGYGEDVAVRLGLPYFKGPLRELMAVVAQLDLLVCNDTGVMHMADALGVRLVAVFGPGDPSFIGPRGGGGVLARPCAGRPCFDHCSQPDAAQCLKAILVDEVGMAVEQGLK